MNIIPHALIFAGTILSGVFMLAGFIAYWAHRQNQRYFSYEKEKARLSQEKSTPEKPSVPKEEQIIDKL